MLWALLSILATLFLAIANIIDKYVLTKFFRDPIAATSISAVVGLIASIVVFGFIGLENITLKIVLLSFVAGICYILMLISYFEATKTEEISRIITLYYLNPLFVSIIAAILLNEILTPLKYFGVFLLVIGAILISVKKLKIYFSRSFWLMIGSSISISFYMIVLKYLLTISDFWRVFALVRIEIFVLLLPILYIKLSNLKWIKKRYGNRPIILLFIDESLTMIATLLVTIAASIGFITLVNALLATRPFFVLLFATILSVFYPQILKEEVSKQTILLKLVAIAIMFLGAWLVM